MRQLCELYISTMSFQITETGTEDTTKNQVGQRNPSPRSRIFSTMGGNTTSRRGKGWLCTRWGIEFIKHNNNTYVQSHNIKSL